MMANELKACPFCKSDARFLEETDVPFGEPYGLVCEHSKTCFLAGNMMADWETIITAWNPRAPASPTGDVGGLERYGVNWKAPNGVTHEPMADGYWTPWHIAADAITALHARVQELEAKWVELPGVE